MDFHRTSSENAFKFGTTIDLQMFEIKFYDGHTNGLVHERRNPIANAPELRLSCINP